MRLALAAALFAAACAGGTAELAGPHCTEEAAHRAGAFGADFAPCPGAPESVAAAYERGVQFGLLSAEIVQLDRLARDLRDGRRKVRGAQYEGLKIVPASGVSGARRALIAVSDADRLEALNDIRDRLRVLRAARETFAL